MVYKKITETDLLNKGVLGLPDTPELSAFEMQTKFEEVAREVIIPAFNLLIDALVADMGNIYTKEEVTQAIREKVAAVGAGDMAMAVYDTDGDGIIEKAGKLAKAVKIGNAQFDGSKGITLTEMGAALKEHQHFASDIANMPTSMKNPNALTLQFNGGTAYEYDGSTGRKFNITPLLIGAALSTHTHQASGIIGMPTALKNPYNLVIQINGNDYAIYDGSTGKTINLTPDVIGAATKTQGTKADNAMPKANFSFDASTGTLNITL